MLKVSVILSVITYYGLETKYFFSFESDECLKIAIGVYWLSV